MKIGIIMAVRNCLALTQAAVNSIRTRFPYQIYVVDDHSDAATKEWLSQRTDIVTIFDPPESTGLASNWNLGIDAALNDGCSHVLVSNNDVLFHPMTIDTLVERASRGDAVLVSGHDVAPKCRRPEDLYALNPGPEELDTESPDFSMFMVTPETVRRVGWFDEQYAGAYYEDNDYHAVIALSGEKAVRCHRAVFYHYGNRTFAENRTLKSEIQARADTNGAYFFAKWGHLPVGTVRDMRREYYPSPFRRGPALGPSYDHADTRIAGLYRRAATVPSDINEHAEYLYRLASTARRVTALTAGTARAAACLLHARPDSLRVFEHAESASPADGDGWQLGSIRTVCAPGYASIASAARFAGIDFSISKVESRCVDIPTTDLLFLDTVHVKERVAQELRAHAPKTRSFIVLHDTETFGEAGELPGTQGIWPAITEFLHSNSEWHLWKHFRHNNGLTVLARNRP